MRASADTTVRTEESRVGSLSKRSLAISWIAGARIGQSTVLAGRQVIGRGEGSDVQLEDDGVSRRHVELGRQGPLYVLRDLESTNGTFLNGRRVQHASFQAGDVLRVGGSVGLVTDRLEDLRCEEIAPRLLAGPELRSLLQPLQQASRSNLAVLLVGSTGTGKERVAQAVHAWSGRQGAFHALNCAAIPAQTAEAELFGYRRGAFTGADRNFEGHIRAAHGGTLFLDEVADLPRTVQPKLLRVVEDQRVVPLGDSVSVEVDVRLVCACQRPLRDLVAEGVFREDLAARLTGLEVRLPALAERRADVVALFRHFLREHSGGRPPALASKLVEALCLHTWPNNVRELETVARQLLAVHGHEPELRREMLPEQLLVELADEGADRGGVSFGTRRDQDLHRLKAALRETGGNVKAAAERLGFSRQRAYRLLEGTEAGGAPDGPRKARAGEAASNDAPDEAKNGAGAR